MTGQHEWLNQAECRKPQHRHKNWTIRTDDTNQTRTAHTAGQTVAQYQRSRHHQELQICNTCPVQQDCAYWLWYEPDSIIGATVPAERTRKPRPPKPRRS